MSSVAGSNRHFNADFYGINRDELQLRLVRTETHRAFTYYDMCELVTLACILIVQGLHSDSKTSFPDPLERELFSSDDPLCISKTIIGDKGNQGQNEVRVNYRSLLRTNLTKPSSIREHSGSSTDAKWEDHHHTYTGQTCDIVPRDYESKSVAELSVTTLKIHACTFCEKLFNSKQALGRHMAIHTGERKFTCSVCQKGFIQKTHLDMHERRHQGIRPFKCKICHKAFYAKQHLVEHLKRTKHIVD